jgi:hypothetical protein
LPDPGANPGRRVGKPATNRFSYGVAQVLRHYIIIKIIKGGRSRRRRRKGN